MPTIAQLPSASSITGQDEIPVSQAGTTRSVSIGELLSQVQPAILTATGTLLGRNSLGPGGPESVAVGLGLGLSSATLAATGADHAEFQEQPALTVTDEVVLSSAGSPRLMSLGLLRGLFSAGSNVTIDGDGVITASGDGAGGAGPAGPEGPAGAAGADGATGDAGPPGPTGPAGPVVNAGSVDAAGNLTFGRSDGATIDVAGVLVGPSGPQGPVGLPGTTGGSGPQGPDGPAGPAGPAGGPGPVISGAAVDSAGHLSLIRSDGATIAATGIVVGPPGVAGAAGPAGPQGPIGETGSAGDTGATGPQGTAGAAGSSINAGTVSPTGVLSFVRSDNSTVAVAGNVVGAPGPTGPEGPIGPQGLAGSGLNNRGAWASGATYHPGDYVFAPTSGTSGNTSLWVVNAGSAYVSTTEPNADQTRWNALTAPTGATGATGSAGATGSQGPQGVAGAAGPSIDSGIVSSSGALSFVRSDGETVEVSGTIVGAAGPQGLTGFQGPAGAAGPTGSQGPAGSAGATINSGAVSPAGALSLVRSDGATIAVAGIIVGATGPAGAAGPQGAAGAAGAAGATGPQGSSVTITTLASTGTIATGDLVGISQGGTDHNITYGNFLAGETGDQLPAAAPVGATDTFLTLQGSSSLYTQPMSALWAWLSTSQIRSYKRPVIELTGSPASVLMDGTVHNGCDLVCSGPVTIVASGNMGSGFECRIFNVSGSAVTLSGFTTDSGATTIATGYSASLDVMTYSGGTLFFAKLGGAATVVTTPGQVTGLASGAITYNSVALSWSAPGSGGAPSSYTVDVAPHGTTTWTGISVAGTSATVTGLSASTSYDFQVISVNAAGSGTPSATLSGVSTIAAPTAAPGPVASLAAGTVTGTSVPLTWAAPTTGGATASYTVNYQVTGAGSFTTFATGLTALSATVTGLSASTSYTFQVVSVNSVGTGQATVTASTTATLAGPGQPGTPTASAITTGGLTLTWAAPSSGGAVATYTAQSSPTGANTWTSQATGVAGLTTAITGLAAATAYDFRIIAVNATGSGTPSGLVTASTTAYAPGAPTALAAGTAASTSMPLTWTAPAVVAGTSSAAVSYTVNYRVTSTGGAFSTISGLSGTSATITGLAAATQYDFEIAAVNTGGTSAFSSIVNGTTVSTNYLLTAGYQPAAGNQTGTHGSGNFAVNLNDNSVTADGTHTVPASVKMGLSSSSTVAPTYFQTSTAGSQSGHHYWYCTLSMSANGLPAGTYYWWGLAYDSGGNLQFTYVSTATITLS